MPNANFILSNALAAAALCASAALAADEIPHAFRDGDPSLAAVVQRAARKLDLPLRISRARSAEVRSS
jgi:hypothetical protein